MGVDSWEIFVEIDLETILILKFWKIFIFWCNLKDIIWGLGALHFDCENWRKDNLRFGIFSGSGAGERKADGSHNLDLQLKFDIWHLNYETWHLNYELCNVCNNVIFRMLAAWNGSDQIATEILDVSQSSTFFFSWSISHVNEKTAIVNWHFDKTGGVTTKWQIQKGANCVSTEIINPHEFDIVNSKLSMDVHLRL